MDNSNLDKLQGDQHTLKLPLELDGSISDFTHQDDIFRPAWEFGDNQPSHPLLPDTLKEVIDPLIAKDISDFTKEHPDVDQNKLMEFRDSQMLVRTFEYIGSLYKEEQVVAVASLVVHGDNLLESVRYPEPQENVIPEVPGVLIAKRWITEKLDQVPTSHQERLIDMRTRVAVDPIHLNAALYAQKLNDKLLDFSAQAEDIEVYKFILDMQKICEIQVNSIMNDISACMPKTTTVEDSIAPLRDEFGLLSYHDLDDPTYIRALSQIFESQIVTPDDVVTVDHLIASRFKPEVIRDLEQESIYSFLIRGYRDGTGRKINKEIINYLRNDPVTNFKRLEDVSRMVDDQHPEFMGKFVNLMRMPRTQGVLAEMLVDIMEVAEPKDTLQVMSLITSATRETRNYCKSLRRLGSSPVDILTHQGMTNDQADKITYSVYKSIQLRLTEQIAAIHSLLQRGAADAVLVIGHDAEGQQITAKSTISNIDQAIFSLSLVSDALLEASLICSRPRRVVLNNIQAKENRATFEYNPGKKVFSWQTSDEGDTSTSISGSRTLISIRNEADTEGEARLGLSRTIPIEQARTIAPALRELLGDVFDENTFLADNRKGKDMRTFSMRLDLENYGQHELSFDIGSTRKPAKEPIGYLLATVISAGAAELARIENESVESLPNNHIKSEFLPESANPESFGRLLKRIIRMLDFDEKWQRTNFHFLNT